MSLKSRQRLTVWAGETRVAMAAGGVAEVIRAPRVTRMPGGPSSLMGVTHLRGKVLPIISLGVLLGGRGGTIDRVVVLRREPALGLAVDGIEALKDLESDGETLADGQLLLDDADGARWFDLATALEAQFSATRAGLRSAATAERNKDAVDSGGARTLAHLAFELAGQAYALPLEAVLEVAAVPPEVLALPRTEEVLVGVAQHRQAVLPILSARALLGLPEPALKSGERLIVTRVGGQKLGLVVDSISAILRTPADRLGPAPSLFNRGNGEAQIKSVLRLSDGRGLVSVLSPDQLLADSRVARLLSDVGKVQEVEVAQPTQADARERFVVMRLGDEQYGLPVGSVDEVIRMPDALTRLPKAPAYVQGVINLRGRVAPIIDLRQRFSVSGEREGVGRVVVVTIGALQAGFAVDAVSTILDVGRDEILPAPDLSDEGPRVFDRAVERDGEVILLIDAQALLDRAEADLLRDLTEKSPAS